MTERNALAHSLADSQERLRSILDSAPALIMTLDREARITSANRMMRGGAPERVIGMSAYAFVAPAAVERVAQTYRRVFETGEPTSYEVHDSGPPGALASYRVHVGPLHRGDEIVGLTLVAFDISDQKALEDELRRSLAQIQDQNARLAGEVEQRRRVEDELLDKQRALLALSTPIIHVWQGVIALPVIGAVDRARAEQMMQRLLEEIVQSGARAAILDLTGVERVDAETVGHLLGIVRAASLLGSRVLLSGIPPEIARAMVELDLGSERLETFARLRDALAHVLRAAAAI